MAADEEPGNKSHEIIWVTREIAVCPPCKRAYRKTRLAAGTSIARAEDLEAYFKQVGIFSKMAPILQERQDKRAEEQKAKDAAKRGSGFRGRGGRQNAPTYD